MAIQDADTFIVVELPTLAESTFTREQAAAIQCPVLSVLGARTEPLRIDVAEFLRSSMPNVEDCLIERAGHLLHTERPRAVARAMSDFLSRNAMAER